MGKTLSGILIFTLTSLTAYLAGVFLTPYIVLLKVKMDSKSEFNQPVYADVISHKDRYVVLPNPDFIYVACGYDIRKSPVRISGTMPDDTYCSVALYSSNTRNYFIRNDQQTPGKKVSMLLVKNGDKSKYEGSEPEEIVESPSTMGTLLVRILIDDTSRIPYLKDIQKTFSVEPQAVH